MSDINKKRHKNGIRLIAAADIKPIKNASGMDHIFQYQGFCKITINQLQSLLYVEPINEEFLPISGMLKWKFFAQKNILFVLAEQHFQDFLLIFKNELRCKKVYDLVYRKRVKDTVTNDQIFRRILSPIFSQIIRISNITISKLLKKWMNKLDMHDRETYTKMMKDDKIYDLIFPDVEFAEEGIMENESEERIQRKRRLSKRNMKDQNVSDVTRMKIQKYSLNVFVKSDFKFKMVYVKIKTKMMKRMLIFPSIGKKFCYEYSRNQFKQNLYSCHGCRKIGEKVYAKIGENENPFIQNKEHVCSAIPYLPEKYSELEIIKKPNFEILENCNSKHGKVLVIFNPNNSSECQEFHVIKCAKIFRCSGCNVRAAVNNISMKNEYVEILKNHECAFRLYDPEKFYKFKNFVLAPNFEIQTKMIGGKEKKILIIFDENNKSKCYIYYYRYSTKLFNCNSCSNRRHHVSAKLQQNSEGEDYIVLSNVKHVCEPVEYIQNDGIILRPPDFKFMEETLTGTPKLFIFDSKKKNLCYVFSRCAAEKNFSRYRCLGCKYITDRKKLGSSSNAVVHLSLFEHGEYFVQIKNQKHLCRPRKYEPEKYERKESKIFDKFFFYRNKRYPNSVNVAIFHPTDSTSCYTFVYGKKNNYFLCMNCKKLKKYYSVSLPKTDENGKQYFIHDQSKHICEPIKISSVQTSKFQTLQRNELTFKEKPKKKEVEIDEKKILKLPNFEFRPSQKGNPEGKLVIFDRNDNTLCYEFFYEHRGKKFVCFKCQKKKHYVTAKIHFDKEKNEKFVELSKNEHICEPIKDEFQDKIINASDFIVINRNDETKITKIIVFTSKTKEFCYEYRYCTSNRCFKCYACSNFNKCVGVKFITKENGEEYLLKWKNEHVCAPKKYEPQITVAESMYELYQNTKGEENKRLIVFTSEKKDFVYDYYWNRNSFYCSKCLHLKKHVTAKLIEKENENYLELSKADHICTPKKYDRKNYKK